MTKLGRMVSIMKENGTWVRSTGSENGKETEARHISETGNTAKHMEKELTPGETETFMKEIGQTVSNTVLELINLQTETLILENTGTENLMVEEDIFGEMVHNMKETLLTE